MKIRGLSFLLAIVMLAGMVAGCSPGDSNSGQERPKDELVLAIGNEPEAGFDPTTGWGRYGSPLFQSTLFTRDQDLAITNDLATGYELSPDGLVWTVSIRTDALFADAEPVTSTDVVYTYQTAKASGSVVDLDVLEKVEALDDSTIKFTLKSPRSTFLYSLASIGIVPAHAHGADYSQHPMGSGPFQFVQWDKGQQLIVEPNPNYYGTKPAFNKITFLFLAEDAAFAAAQSGLADVASVAASMGTQEVAGMKLVALESVDNRGIMFPYQRSGKKTEEGYPIGNDVTADIAIRHAINLAVDRTALVAGVLNGFGTPAYSVCDKMPWWNPATTVADADVSAAENLLAAAGWKDTDGDGIREKDGLKATFTLVYPSSDGVRQSLAIAMADMVKPLGIQIDVVGKSWDDIEKVMHSEAVLFGWGSHDPLEMYNLYSSKFMGVEYYNPGYYANPTVDQYMEKALAELDETKANAFWQKSQWDGQTGFAGQGDAPWVWLVNLQHVYFVREGLDIGTQKVQPHGHGWPITDNIADWKWEN
jgi:peptide/nickel transport system substrate-binding protein